MESVNKYPFVFVSGLFFPTHLGPLQYFHKIADCLEGENVKIILPKLTAFEPHKPRVKRLIRELDRLYPEGKFHLVGHSRGGNDACAVLQSKRFENRVASIVTINTPHRATPLANLFSKIFFLSKTFKELRPKNFSFWHKLSQVAVDLNIPIFSANTFIPSKPLQNTPRFLVLCKKLMGKEHWPCDGFVPHSSSRWGKELFLTNGDHVAPIGFPFGLLPRFDQCGFFRDVIFQIRKELPDGDF